MGAMNKGLLDALPNNRALLENSSPSTPRIFYTQTDTLTHPQHSSATYQSRLGLGGMFSLVADKSVYLGRLQTPLTNDYEILRNGLRQGFYLIGEEQDLKWLDTRKLIYKGIHDNLPIFHLVKACEKETPSSCPLPSQGQKKPRSIKKKSKNPTPSTFNTNKWKYTTLAISACFAGYAAWVNREPLKQTSHICSHYLNASLAVVKQWFAKK